MIKERIKVEPKGKTKHLQTVQSLSQSYTIRFEMDWDIPEREAISNLVYPIGYANSGPNDWITGGSQSITLSGNETNIFFMFQFKVNLDEYEECYVSYRIFFDDDMVQSGSNRLVGKRTDIPYVNVGFKPPIANDFSLNIYRDYDCNDIFGFIDLVPKYNELDQYWRTDKPVNFTITKGAEYFQFASKETNALYGTTLEITDWELGFYYLHINSVDVPFEFNEVDITIKGNTSEIEHNASTGFLTIVDGGFSDNKRQIIKNEKVKINAWLKNTYCDQILDIPEGTTFSAEITEGKNYGKLINPKTGETEDVLNNIISENNLVELEFLANEDEPIGEDSIVIIISCSIPTVQNLELDLIIKPTELVVEVEPNLLSPGDTANVLLKYKKSDGSLIDYPVDQTFDIEFISGAEFGNFLLVDGETVGKSFYDIESGFKLIAEDSIALDNAEMSLKVTTYSSPIDYGAQIDPTSNPKNKKGGNKDKVNFIEPFYGIANVKIGNNEEEILLGETKYYGLKKKENEYIIAEIPTAYGNEPKWSTVTLTDGWEWQKENSVWGSDPIEKLGNTSGVYWEKKWFRSSDNSNQPLLAGMIRLIGRYWEDGKENDFKVKLKATDKAEIVTKVVKPDELLSEVQIPSYSKARDVFDKEYSIDSLCIVQGGKSGIPPQYLKGQMFTESAKKDFGGTIGVGFAPSYVYEPFTTQFSDNVKKMINDNNKFVVTENAMGSLDAASVPTSTEHQYIQPVHYYVNKKSIWDIVDANSQITDKNNLSTYGYRYEDGYRKGRINFYSYSTPKNEQISQLGKATVTVRKKYQVKDNDKLSLLQHEEINNMAREEVGKFIKDKWEINGTKGLDNIIAQTRIAASYGLLQSLYTTAVIDNKYPTSKDDRPENLSVVSTGLTYALKNLQLLFKRHNKISLDVPDNWVSKRTLFPNPSAGFEEALQVMFYKWNPDKKNKQGESIYHTEVLNNSKQFLPRR